MEAFQALMLGLHALAIANGNVPVAWITLIARLDGGSQAGAPVQERRTEGGRNAATTPSRGR